MAGLLAWVGFALGILLLGGTSLSVLHTVAGPRGRSSRLASRMGRSTESAGRWLAVRLNTPARQDRILSVVAPLAFLLVLLAWLLCYVIAYALLTLPFVAGPVAALRLSGSSVFTLGYAAPSTPASGVLVLCAACTGLVVVTLELAYLPSLYAAYNRRELLVTMLTSRCGGRLSGQELLLSHLEAGWSGGLTELFRDWEFWAADVRETHSNYPILISFRAGDPAASWPWALLTVLDAALLHQVMLPGRCPQAQATLRIGTDLALALAPGERPGEQDLCTGLPDIDLAVLQERLALAGHRPPGEGVPLECAQAQWQARRACYAPAIAAIAWQLLLPSPTLPDREMPRTASSLSNDRNR